MSIIKLVSCVPEKAGPEKYWQIWRYVTKRFKQSFLIYISNCHIVYLSLAKKNKQTNKQNKTKQTRTKQNRNDLHQLVFKIWLQP